MNHTTPTGFEVKNCCCCLLLSRAWLFPTLWTTVYHRLPLSLCWWPFRAKPQPHKYNLPALKNLQNASAGENVEKSMPSCTLVGAAAAMEKSVCVLSVMSSSLQPRELCSLAMELSRQKYSCGWPLSLVIFLTLDPSPILGPSTLDPSWPWVLP